MKQMKRLLLMLGLIMMSAQSAWAASWYGYQKEGSFEINGLTYDLYAIKNTWDDGSTSWRHDLYGYEPFAVLTGVGSKTRIVVPVSVGKDGHSYYVKTMQISSGEIIKSITFEGSVVFSFQYLKQAPLEGSNVSTLMETINGFFGPIPQHIYFKGTTPTFSGSYRDYFWPVTNVITVHLKGKTQAECDLLHNSVSVWSDFKAVLPYIEGEELEIIDFADSNVKTICVNAGWDANGDGELSIPEAAAVTSLGDVFKGNTNITSFNESQYFTGLTEIPQNAFNGCTNLTSVTLPEGIATIIQEKAFYNCTLLETINFPLNLTEIGASAFMNCYALKSIALPNGLETIGNRAFSSCSALTSVIIPKTVTSIGPGVFSGCTSLEYLAVDKESTKYDSREGCNAIIETATNTLVSGCQYSHIPEGVQAIARLAFYNIPIKKVTIPASVTSLAQTSFADCSQLVSIECKGYTVPTATQTSIIECPNLVVTVPREAVGKYRSATGWKNLTVMPAGLIGFADSAVKTICLANWDTNSDGELSYAEAAAVTTLVASSTGKSAFYNNSTITSFNELQYFTGLTTLEDNVFYLCTKLASVTLPSTITSIGQSAFSGCKLLKNVFLHEGITSIGQYAFNTCEKLISITLPQSLTTIGDFAFMESGLRGIYIPAGVTSLGKILFAKCKDLTSIVVDQNNTVYDSRNNCSAIIETASNTLKEGCRTTIIPETITAIGDYAFRYRGIPSLVVPESVSAIGRQAFMCTNQTYGHPTEYLQRLELKWKTPVTVQPEQFGTETIDYPKQCTLVVPAGKKQAYINAGWLETYFKEIVEADETERYDVNRDGSISIADVTTLVNKILGKPTN